MKLSTLEAKVTVAIEHEDDWETEDLISLAEDVIMSDQASLNSNWDLCNVEFSKTLGNDDSIVLIKSEAILDSKVKSFCPYCGLNLREVDRSEMVVVENDGCCPNCGE